MHQRIFNSIGLPCQLSPITKHIYMTSESIEYNGTSSNKKLCNLKLIDIGVCKVILQFICICICVKRVISMLINIYIRT